MNRPCRFIVVTDKRVLTISRSRRWPWLSGVLGTRAGSSLCKRCKRCVPSSREFPMTASSTPCSAHTPPSLVGSLPVVHSPPGLRTYTDSGNSSVRSFPATTAVQVTAAATDPFAPETFTTDEYSSHLRTDLYALDHCHSLPATNKEVSGNWSSAFGQM